MCINHYYFLQNSQSKLIPADREGFCEIQPYPFDCSSIEGSQAIRVVDLIVINKN
jgi:hypothetical protein